MLSTIPRGQWMRIIQLVSRTIAVIIVLHIGYKSASIQAETAPAATTQSTTQSAITSTMTRENMITVLSEVIAALLGAGLDLYLHGKQDDEKVSAPAGKLFPDGPVVEPTPLPIPAKTTSIVTPVVTVTPPSDDPPAPLKFPVPPK